MTPDIAELLESTALPDIVEELSDRLARERGARAKFYDGIDEGTKAEFINGEVVTHSPDRAKHIGVRGNLENLISNYVRIHRCGTTLSEKALCVFPRNDYMPDICFWLPEKAASIEADTRKFPQPDFVVEILSASTEAKDRGQKLEDFECHGVGEYWIIDADKQMLEQYVAREGRFQLALKSGSGEVSSEVIKEFKIAIAAIFDGKANLTALEQMLTA
tara:strand:+ start:4865 stop:5518 length:654 start_codon:yes stop_codon:yes gene_type:complete